MQRTLGCVPFSCSTKTEVSSRVAGALSKRVPAEYSNLQ
jgi:hypothetical protein